MNRSTIRFVIGLSVMLLIGLVSTQIYWVRNAYQLQESQINYDITQALKRVAQQILLANSDSTQLYDPIEQVTPNLFKVRIRETIQPYYLETLLANEFKKEEINLLFEYHLYDCFNDSVVFKKLVQLDQQNNKFESKTPEMNWDNDAHYFSVFFPNKKSKLLEQFDFWIISSVILLFIVLFFGYTIWIILKQRRLSEVKTDFINNMTHELKTPISTISLSAKVLLKPDIINNPERLKNYASIINLENERLHQQVEKVLQIATLEKEKVDLVKEQINVHELIDQAVNTIQLIIKEKGGGVTSDLAAKNATINADRVHISNVLSNLLDNANKYTPVKPLITISTKNEKKGILISIEDNGIGIPKKALKIIFDKFYRVPKGDVHDVKGFGIGLHYVKVMIDYHKGKIEIKSELNQGTTINIYLPF